jgi:hypothetical protein
VATDVNEPGSVPLLDRQTVSTSGEPDSLSSTSNIEFVGMTVSVYQSRLVHDAMRPAL